MEGSDRMRGPSGAFLLAARGKEEAPHGVSHTPVTSCGELRGVGRASGKELRSTQCILISPRAGGGVVSKVAGEMVWALVLYLRYCVDTGERWHCWRLWVRW